MRNHLLMLFSVLLITQLSSQSFIDKNYSQYTDLENATRVQVSGKMFDFASVFIEESEKAGDDKVLKMVSNIKSFDLLMVPDLSNPLAEFNKGIKAIGTTQEELIRVKDKNTRFALLVNEKNGVVTQITGIGALDTAFLVFSLEGQFNLDELGAITEKIQNEGAKKFGLNATNTYDEVKVYPNPVAAGSLIKIDLPSNMSDASISVYDSNGRPVAKHLARNNGCSIETIGYNAGEYLVEISKDGTTFKKKIIVIN